MKVINWTKMLGTALFIIGIALPMSSSAELVTLTADEVADLSRIMNEKENGFRVKAEQGDTDAMNVLGNMLGISTEAFYWIRRAAESGHILAQNNLSRLYANGYGVPKNTKLAYVWSSIASANGYKPAVSSRDFYMTELSPLGLEEAQDMATELFEKYQNKSQP